MVKVYIASPYSIGDQQANVDRSFAVANTLIDYGFAPYCPLYGHYLHLKKQRDWNTWMQLDTDWILACDCLLRVSGESSGADMEVRFALDHDIPVFFNLDQLIAKYT